MILIPGTIIWTDQWAAYSNVSSLSHVSCHSAVNHSIEFIAPTSTNIESYWNRVKMRLERMKGCVELEVPFNVIASVPLDTRLRHSRRFCRSSGTLLSSPGAPSLVNTCLCVMLLKVSPIQKSTGARAHAHTDRQL